MDLSSILAAVAAIPVVGKVLGVIVVVDLALKALVNALVALWAAVVLVVQALAQIPGLSSLQSLADKMKADETVIDSESSKILALLDRLSSLKIPQAPKSQA